MDNLVRRKLAENTVPMFAGTRALLLTKKRRGTSAKGTRKREAEIENALPLPLPQNLGRSHVEKQKEKERDVETSPVVLQRNRTVRSHREGRSLEYALPGRITGSVKSTKWVNANSRMIRRIVQTRLTLGLAAEGEVLAVAHKAAGGRTDTPQFIPPKGRTFIATSTST